MPRVRRVRGEVFLALALLNIFVLFAGLVTLDVIEARPLPAEPNPVTDAEGAVAAQPAGAAPADPGRIADILDDPMSDSGLEDGLSGFVADGASGDVLFEQDADASVVPASTTKIATAVAALAAAGPDHVLRTETHFDAEADRVVLRGAGDATLTTSAEPGDYPRVATLEDLAQRTASGLAEQGVETVSLGYDDTLFTGSDTAPGWKSSYVSEGHTAPAHALLLDGGRVSPEVTTRSPDPPLAAAEAFADELENAGITVEGEPDESDANGEVLAGVESAPVASLVEFMMLESDNSMAEALGRIAAIGMGEEVSYEGAVEATHSVMADLGIDGVELSDNSGLSTENRMTPRSMAELLAAAVDPEHPELNATVTGLPTANSTGTLAGRYSDYSDTNEGAGLVRGKTGTLDGVSALAGTVYDQEGNVFVYAFVANDPGASGPALDSLAAALSRCGCS